MIGESCFNIIKALIVRFALALHIILTVWRVTENLYDQNYWLLLCLMIPFIIEGLYSIIRRQGKEYLWFSPCFFFYLCATLPPIWLLELDKSAQVRDKEMGINETQHEHQNNTFNDLTAKIPVSLNPNMWTIVIEEMLLYLLVIGRWILPRGEVTREQLSELLFAFIGIAADVMEFFSLFGENHVRNDEILGYLLLAIWSLSILQFTMAVTVTQQPKRAKKIKTVRARDSEPDKDEDSKLSSELGAIFISMVMQDVPFLALRLYTIITYNLITYSLIFFTSKNVLVISLLFYKVAVILQMRYCPEVSSKKDGNEEKIIGGFGDTKAGKGERKGKGDNDNVSLESYPSKYALPYEYAGVVSTNEKGPAQRSPNKNGDSELSKRSASKTSVESNGTRSNKSTEKEETRQTRQDSRPYGLNLTPSDEKEKTKSPGSNGKLSTNSSSTGTPKSPNVASIKESKNSPGSEQEEELGSRKDFSEPVIITPTEQTAQPGDPDFKPYTSVVRLP